MSGEFFTELLDFGALGIFAGFLVWLYVGMQRRLDALVEKFQIQLDRINADCAERNDKINADYDSRIEKMRERYDIVIREAREEGSEAMSHMKVVSKKLDKALLKIDEGLGSAHVVLEKVDEGLTTMREYHAEMEIHRRVKEASKE